MASTHALVPGRKQAEQQLVLQATALETAANAIAITDRSGTILWVNPAFATLTGYARDEVIGQNPRILKSGLHDRAFYKNLWSTILRGDTWRGGFTNRRKDGSLYHDEHTITPVRTDDGEITHFVAIMEDVTERKRAEAEIRKLNAELEQRVRERTTQLVAAIDELEAFSYSISHDLRAPLRAMSGFAHLLSQQFGQQLPPEGRAYLNRISDNATRLGQLIEGLLTFARLNRQPLKKKIVAPTDLARAALEDLRAELAGRSADIRIADMPPCEADPLLLRQIFANLLSNALKYSRHRNPAVIRVGSRNTGSEAIYFVQDNGAGFNMDYAPKLFRVFQRLHSAREFEGTGVGLAIVQRIVQRHGGRIWAEAKVDQGATFFFTLEPPKRD